LKAALVGGLVAGHIVAVEHLGLGIAWQYWLPGIVMILAATAMY